MVSSREDNVNSNYVHMEYRNVMVTARPQAGMRYAQSAASRGVSRRYGHRQRHVGRDNDAHHPTGVEPLVERPGLTIATLPVKVPFIRLGCSA